MKQYRYRPEEIGRTEWPSGELRLDGIEVTTNPDEADLFVCPGPLLLFQKPSDLDRFPYMKGREDKHVFFDVSDYETVYDKPCIFIRCNLRTWMLARDVNSVSWSWPVEDMSECIAVPDGGFKYDVSFQGWNWSDVRKASIQSCLNAWNLRCDIATYTDFFGYLKDYDPEFHRRRAEFRRSMRESRIALCPESIPGVFPYRFFEAMSAGRVPLLVGSGYVLPWADEIPYDQFTIRVQRESAADVGMVAQAALSIGTDADFIEMGLKARHYYETFLHRDKWASLMADAIKKKLGVLV